MKRTEAALIHVSARALIRRDLLGLRAAPLAGSKRPAPPPMVRRRNAVTTRASAGRILRVYKGPGVREAERRKRAVGSPCFVAWRPVGLAEAGVRTGEEKCGRQWELVPR